ncbi:MAG: aspartate dehydrogenase [Clostridiales bacterium]|nr:aspartate dehydrogenase [Clostridiales bacterium]
MKLFDRGQKKDNEISFDPETQYAVIRSSICTGEKVAGFKNKKDGHFTEVMVIRSSLDEKRFMSMYGIDKVRTEY